MNIYIKSVLITLLVGSAIGSTIAYLGDISYTKCILGSTVAQVIFFAIYNNVRASRESIKMETEMTLRIREFAKQGVETECAHCGSMQYIPVRFDEDNEFTCTECGKSNAVYISVTTAQKTHPLKVQPLQVNTVIAEEIAAKKKIQDG